MRGRSMLLGLLLLAEACGTPKPAATAPAPAAPAPAAPLPAYEPPPEEEDTTPRPYKPLPIERSPPPDPAVHARLDAKEAAACKARGGELRPVCMAGNPECVLKFRDAGKKCSDKKDCAGKCLFTGDQRPAKGAKVTGQCERDNDPCGCRDVIVGGNIVSSLCVD